MHVLECGSRMRSQKSVHVAQFGTCGLVYTLVVVVKLSKVFCSGFVHGPVTRELGLSK